MPIEYWDQPRIAREFGIAQNTVASTWRNNTIKAVEAHLRAHGVDDFEAELGVPIKGLTKMRWREVKATKTWGPLRLPDGALPLPDAFVGTKPAWTAQGLRGWARVTGRRDDDGTLRRAAPPGRPPGIVETKPRRRRAE